MRDLTETLATGPYLDDTHRAAVEATAVDLGKTSDASKQWRETSDASGVYGEMTSDAALTAALGRTGRNRRRAATDGVFGVGARSTCVEAENGPLRGFWGGLTDDQKAASLAYRGEDCAPVTKVYAALVELSLGYDDKCEAVSTIYTAAIRILDAAGPMPLVSYEPWVERDEEYRERLRGTLFDHWIYSHSGSDLTFEGEDHGLPRARLVPVKEP